MGVSNAKRIRCAIYTRKSSDEGLDQSFNSLDAQREACEAYIASQGHEGWIASSERFDDGGYSGGNVERPALSRLLDFVSTRAVDVIVVYKLDRLSRSLADFVRLIERFDEHEVSFVSITQHFNTSTSMGRLTLNVLLSFAQFEREVTGERIRDKIAASKKKGIWMGGRVPLGYDLHNRSLHVNEQEADTVRHIFERYLALGCVRRLKSELDTAGYLSKPRPAHHKIRGSKPFSRGMLYAILKNPLYIGKVHHGGELFDGQHDAIVLADVWQAVQSKLASQSTRHKNRENARHPSLLAGRLEDLKGNRLSPTYTQRRGKRYSYYVNQALLQFKDAEFTGLRRLPAAELDGAVEEMLLNLLRSPTQLIDSVGTLKLAARQIEQLLSAAEALVIQWRSYQVTDKIALLEALHLTVTVSEDRVTLSLSGRRLAEHLLNSQSARRKRQEHLDEAALAITLSAPICVRRSGIGKKLIIYPSPKAHAKAHPRSVKALQRAVLNALRWNDALVTGRASSIDALVKQEGLNRRQVYRLRQLAFLAPDIIERIAEGDIPETLTLEKLKSGIPMDWSTQRRQFLES